MELKQVVNAVPALSKLAGTELGLKTAYRVNKMVSALEKEVDFFNAQRKRIAAKYGVPNENGGYDFTEENELLAQREFEELMDMEVCPGLGLLEIDLSERIALTSNDVGALEPFVRFVGSGEE